MQSAESRLQNLTLERIVSYIPLPSFNPGRSRWLPQRVALGVSAGLIALMSGVGCAAVATNPEGQRIGGIPFPAATPAATAESNPQTTLLPAEIIDLNQIPKLKENETKNALSAIQRIMEHYINTSEKELGLDLANNYRQNLDAITANPTGQVGWGQMLFGNEIQNVLQLDRTSPSSAFTSFYLRRKTDTKSGKFYDTLALGLNSEGQISDFPSWPYRPQFISMEDVRKYIKIFKIPAGWTEEKTSESTFANIYTLEIERRYPDDSYLRITGDAIGIFQLYASSKSPAYIKP